MTLLTRKKENNLKTCHYFTQWPILCLEIVSPIKAKNSYIYYPLAKIGSWSIV